MARRPPARPDPAAAPAPFLRPIPVRSRPVRSRPRERPFAFDIAPEPDEKPAIARFLGIEALRSLRFRGELAPDGKDGWRVAGRLEAEIVQNCVVTLAPVTGRIDEAVVRSYLPEETFAPPAEIEIDADPDAEDDPDPYGASIDPGVLAIESLVLALDPYPRAPGIPAAEFHAGPPGAPPLSDPGQKPFAGLAALREKFGENGKA